ncbi:uncharacterized protein LOC120329759 [Styela clava]
MAKKGKKGKGGKKKSKRVKWDEDSDIYQKKFLGTYEMQCTLDKSIPCVWLQKALKKGIEDRMYARKFIIEEVDVGMKDPNTPPVRLRPVVRSIRNERFTHVHEICCWDLETEHDEVADLALLLEKGFYPVRRIELMDCDIQHFTVARFSKAFRVSNLVEINLDYNEFGDAGCVGLCNGLKNNKIMLSISLCYCGLTPKSGEPLGEVLCKTTVREFFLDGNQLQCDGVIEMLRYAAANAEHENSQRIEEEKMKALMIAEGALETSDKMLTSQVTTDGGVTTEGGADSAGSKPGSGKKKKKKKKKGKKKKKAEALPPVVGPYVHVLHIGDNGIDSYGPGREDKLFLCIEVLKRMLMYSQCFIELDMDDNVIGDMAARELLAGLDARKLGNLPAVKVRTTAELGQTTYESIAKFSFGMKKKKKKGKKKKKK